MSPTSESGWVCTHFDLQYIAEGTSHIVISYFRFPSDFFRSTCCQGVPFQNTMWSHMEAAPVYSPDRPWPYNSTSWPDTWVTKALESSNLQSCKLPPTICVPSQSPIHGEDKPLLPPEFSTHRTPDHWKGLLFYYLLLSLGSLLGSKNKQNTHQSQLLPPFTIHRSIYFFKLNKTQ